MREFPHACLTWLLLKWIIIHLNSNNATKNTCKVGKNIPGGSNKVEDGNGMLWITLLFFFSACCRVFLFSLVFLLFPLLVLGSLLSCLLCFLLFVSLLLCLCFFSITPFSEGLDSSSPDQRKNSLVICVFSLLSLSVFCFPSPSFLPVSSFLWRLSQSKKWTPVSAFSFYSLCLFFTFPCSFLSYCLPLYLFFSSPL